MNFASSRRRYRLVPGPLAVALCGACCVAALAAPPAAAPVPATPPAPESSKPAEQEFKGQADLNAAIAAKVVAGSLEDFENVIQLCDQAILHGLDPKSRIFAQKMSADTRVTRVTKLCESIFTSSTPDPRWRQIREISLTDLDAALADDPDNGQAHLLVARLHALPGGNRKRAAAEADSAIRLSNGDPILRSEALVVRGDLTVDRKRRLADYNEALELQPENVAGLRSRGYFFFESQEHAAAKADLEKAVELQPEHAATQRALGADLFMLKDNKGALVHLNKAIELAPDQPSMYGIRARVLAVLGQNDKALADADRAQRLAPDDVTWLLLRAHILAASKKVPQAVEELERAAAAAPDDLDLAAELATFYSLDKKPKKAIAIYDKVLARGTNLPQFFHGRADAYLSIGKQKEAIADYDAVLKEDPKDSGVLNNLAWVLATSPDAKLRDGKRAIELAKRACDETEYKAAHILSTLAAAYAETGDFQTAIKWSKKSLAAADQPGADDITDDTVRAALKNELANYLSGKPTRELENEEKDDAKSTAKEKGTDTAPDKATDQPAKKDGEKPSAQQGSTNSRRPPAGWGKEPPNVAPLPDGELHFGEIYHTEETKELNTKATKDLKFNETKEQRPRGVPVDGPQAPPQR